MPTYAIVGATRKTGITLLDLLLRDPANKINRYLASKPTLLSRFSDFEQSKSVEIFEGGLNDILSLASCISNADTIFSVTGEPSNHFRMHPAQDVAKSIIAALCHLGLAMGVEKVPKLITWSPCPKLKIAKDGPLVAEFLYGPELGMAYTDLKLAEQYLRLHGSWLRVGFVQPGGLMEDEYQDSTSRLFYKDGASFVTFQDIAVRMVEIAQGAFADGIVISVVPASKDVASGRSSLEKSAISLIWNLAPWFLGWLLGLESYRIFNGFNKGVSARK